MKKFIRADYITLPLICDTLFSVVRIFILLFACVRFYTKSLLYSLLIAIPLSLFCAMGICLVLLLKRSKQTKANYHKKAEQELALYLCLLPHKALQKMFAKFSTPQDMPLFCFKIEALSQDDVLSVLRGCANTVPAANTADTYSYKKTNNCMAQTDGIVRVLYCNILSEKAAALCRTLNIKTLTVAQIYSLLKENNALPAKEQLPQKLTIGKWQTCKEQFKRKLFLPFFRYGVLLLLFSYFTFYPVYYLICGCLLILLALLALLFGKR